MKKIVCGLLAVFVMTGCSSILAKRNPNERLAADVAGIFASNRVAYVAGGESVQTAVTSDVLKALAEKANDPNEAAYFRYTQFGQDTAPDQPVVDTAALEAKNDLGGVVEKLMKSKSPQAAAALEALQMAKGSMESWSKPIPQGDRSGGAQLVGFVGASTDAKAVAMTDAENIAAMRLRQFPRANAATTTTRTERQEWTEPALQIVADAAVAVSSNYWAFTLASKAMDEQEVAEAPEDPGTPEPVPSPNAPGLVEAADRQGTQALLWKPASDSDGNLVVLLPAMFNGIIDGGVTVNGDKGRFTSVANGNRSHFRFGKPGAAYGANAQVKWSSNGKAYTVTIPNGAARTTIDKIAAPPVKQSDMPPADPVAPAGPVSPVTPQPEVPAGPGEPVAP